MFLHVSVILFIGGGVVSQHALQVSRPTPRGEVEGSDQLGGSPGPHPRGKLRGLALGGLQAHTPGGLQAHNWGVSRLTPGGSLGPHPRGSIPTCTEADPPMATAVGGMHPTGMRSCFCKAFPLQNYHLKKLP